MPGVKRKTAATKKKNAPKKRMVAKKPMSFTSVNPILAKFPLQVSGRAGPNGNALWTTMVFTQRNNMATGALGAPGIQLYRLNSLFDPDATGVGQQPMFYDQLSPIYQRYCVYQVEYKIVVCNQSTSLDAIVGIQANADATTSTDVDRYIMNGNCEWNIVERNNGAAIRTFQGTVDLPSMASMTKEQYMADDQYQGIVSGNPGIQFYLKVFAANVDETSGTTGLVRMYTELRYKCKLFNQVLTVLS